MTKQFLCIGGKLDRTYQEQLNAKDYFLFNRSSAIRREPRLKRGWQMNNYPSAVLIWIGYLE